VAEQKELVAPVAGEITELSNKYGKRTAIQHFALPSGNDHPLLFFEAKAVGAIVFAVTSDQKVITIRQFRYGAQAFIEELPGGQPDGDNDEVVRRELRQETGFTPRGAVIELNGPLWFEPVSFRARYRPFLALDCVYECNPEPEEDEVMEVKLYSLQDWAKMIGDGTINDDKTIAVSMRAYHHLGWRISAP